MNVARGDVVLVDYPYAGGRGSKMRPALVVQADRDNQRLANTIIVQITGVTHRALEPTQFFIGLSEPDARRTGLRQDSVVNCANILTIDKHKVLRKIGALPISLLQKVDACLLAALGLRP
jgi:mRNA interferase MazF